MNDPQFTTLQLLWHLLLSLIRRGNLPVYYHGLHPYAHDAPLEVVRLEVREPLSGPKLTLV